MRKDKEFGGMVRQATKGVESADFFKRLSVHTTLDNANAPFQNSRKDEFTDIDRVIDQRDARNDDLVRRYFISPGHKPEIQTTLDKE